MALAQQMDKHQRLMVVVGSLVRDLPKKTWAPKCPGPFYSVRRAMRRSVDQTGARCGQVLDEKQPTTNQCGGLFFVQLGATGHR